MLMMHLINIYKENKTFETGALSVKPYRILLASKVLENFYS